MTSDARWCETCGEWTLLLPNGTCGWCLSLVEPQRRHGTRSTYATGCRCRACVFAESEYQRVHKRRRYHERKQKPAA